MHNLKNFKILFRINTSLDLTTNYIKFNEIII